MNGLLTKDSCLCKAIVTSEADEAQGFRRINLKSIKIGQKMPFDLYLKYVSDSKARVNYLLGCTKNAVFEAAWAQKLEDMGIQWVYFASQDQALVLRYLATNLRTMLMEDSLDRWDKAVLIHDTLSTWIHLFFMTEKKRTGPLIKLASTLVEDLIGLINEDENFVEIFLNISRHGDLLYSHSLNVSLMNLAFARYLSWPEDDAVAFGLGGLLHDIGMTSLPPEIIEKSSALTVDEQVLVRKHPQDSYNIVIHLPYLPKEVLFMALQHHENSDGSGYPWGLRLKEIHKWARILRVIDSYESVTAGRPWRAGVSPSAALWQMKSDWQLTQAYDLEILKSFIQFMAGSRRQVPDRPEAPRAFSH
jgi:HD-GYP domain-containing protein (c-di-GMP phosphodiesterase class II)